MTPGCIPTGEGLRWFERDPRRGLSPFAEILAGTSSLMWHRRLEAWRCTRCSLVLLRYGKFYEEEDGDEGAGAPEAL